MDWMPYFAAVCGVSSTLSLTTFTLPSREPAISSSAGAIWRHGPHHSAQKSTTTGLVAFNTSVSNVLSDTLPTVMGITSSSSRRKSNLWMRRRSVKASSRRGDGGERVLHRGGRDFHQVGNFRPYERRANGFVRIKLQQSAAIERKLTNIGGRDGPRFARRPGG